MPFISHSKYSLANFPNNENSLLSAARYAWMPSKAVPFHTAKSFRFPINHTRITAPIYRFIHSENALFAHRTIGKPAFFAVYQRMALSGRRSAPLPPRPIRSRQKSSPVTVVPLLSRVGTRQSPGSRVARLSRLAIFFPLPPRRRTGLAPLSPPCALFRARGELRAESPLGRRLRSGRRFETEGCSCGPINSYLSGFCLSWILECICMSSIDGVYSSSVAWLVYVNNAAFYVYYEMRLRKTELRWWFFLASITSDII